jgi:hypothetical protein
MLEILHTHEGFCNVCSYLWALPPISAPLAASARPPSSDLRTPRFDTLDQLIRRCGLRRDEVATLAEIGALNAFGFDRRTALWQVEQAVRPAGELFADAGDVNSQLPTPNSQLPTPNSQGDVRSHWLKVVPNWLVLNLFTQLHQGIRLGSWELAIGH